jgi:murein DD-endopeptidase MepM/ murein hydrolase activator NlpD
MIEYLASAAIVPPDGTPQSSVPSAEVVKVAPGTGLNNGFGKGIVLVFAGILIGGPGYCYSYLHQSVLGTLAGLLGLVLCILGTARAEGPVHR